MVRRWCIRPLMVKAIGGHFLDAVGHRSYASENPSSYLPCKDAARLERKRQLRTSDTGPHTLTIEKCLKTTHTIPRRANILFGASGWPPKEGFSLEKFEPGEASRRLDAARDSVVIEGTLQDDGDYYVINRDPARPGELLCVRKGDVLHLEKTRTICIPGGPRELFSITIRRGVPVRQSLLTSSSSLEIGRSKRVHQP